MRFPWNSLCSLGWCRTHDLPTSATQVMDGKRGLSFANFAARNKDTFSPIRAQKMSVKVLETRLQAGAPNPDSQY